MHVDWAVIVTAKENCWHRGRTGRRSGLRRLRRGSTVATGMSGVFLTGVWRRLIALSCVIGMSCGASGILPAVVVLVGQLDSDHQVVVSSSGKELVVRFCHVDETTAGQMPDGKAALVNNAQTSDADHVMQFASSGHLLAQLPASAAPDPSSQCLTALQIEQWKPVVRSYEAIPHARPPPDEATLIRRLRSVVLLV